MINYYLIPRTFTRQEDRGKRRKKVFNRKVIIQSINQSLVLIDSINRLLIHPASVSQSISLTQAIRLTFPITIHQSLVFNETVIQYHYWRRNLTDSLMFNESVVANNNNQLSTSISDNLVFNQSVNRQVINNRIISQTLLVTDKVNIVIQIRDHLSLIDNIKINGGSIGQITDTLVLSDYFTVSKINVIHFNQFLGVTDQFIFNRNYSSRAIHDQLSLTQSFNRNACYNRVFINQLLLNQTITKAVIRKVSDRLFLTEVIDKSLGLAFYDSLTLTESLILGLKKSQTIRQTLPLINSYQLMIPTAPSAQLNDPLLLVDTIRYHVTQLTNLIAVSNKVGETYLIPRPQIIIIQPKFECLWGNRNIENYFNYLTVDRSRVKKKHSNTLYMTFRTWIPNKARDFFSRNKDGPYQLIMCEDIWKGYLIKNPTLHINNLIPDEFLFEVEFFGKEDETYPELISQSFF